MNTLFGIFDTCSFQHAYRIFKQCGTLQPRPSSHRAGFISSPRLNQLMKPVFRFQVIQVGGAEHVKSTQRTALIAFYYCHSSVSPFILQSL